MFSPNKPKEKKEKTFNDLDPDFQWNETLDPDHIFDQERELINQVKKELPELADEQDKFILVFLIARRHDVPATVSLLKKFIKIQSQYGYSSRQPPSYTHHPLLPADHKKLIFPALHPIGLRDKHNRMLRYFFFADDNPGDRHTKNVYAVLSWQTYYLIQLEPLSAWRNGIVTVVDLKDFGWKNLDMSAKGRAINKDIQGAFPFRLRSFLVINGGAIVGALFSAAKLIVPKKIMSRVEQLSDPALLKEYIPTKYLIKKYDEGELHMDYEEYVREILEKEAILYQEGKWKPPTTITPTFDTPEFDRSKDSKNNDKYAMKKSVSH